VPVDLDPFARVNAERSARAAQEQRKAEVGSAKQEAQQRIKDTAARREALARPDPAYRPRLPMRFDV
jgi:hypothetical protein